VEINKARRQMSGQQQSSQRMGGWQGPLRIKQPPMLQLGPLVALVALGGLDLVAGLAHSPTREQYRRVVGVFVVVIAMLVAAAILVLAFRLPFEVVLGR
jgi:hypothetical protein